MSKKANKVKFRKVKFKQMVARYGLNHAKLRIVPEKAAKVPMKGGGVSRWLEKLYGPLPETDE